VPAPEYKPLQLGRPSVACRDGGGAHSAEAQAQHLMTHRTREGDTARHVNGARDAAAVVHPQAPPAPRKAKQVATPLCLGPVALGANQAAPRREGDEERVAPPHKGRHVGARLGRCDGLLGDLPLEAQFSLHFLTQPRSPRAFALIRLERRLGFLQFRLQPLRFRGRVSLQQLLPCRRPLASPGVHVGHKRRIRSGAHCHGVIVMADGLLNGSNNGGDGRAITGTRCWTSH
jgi:hypothetical protein